MCLILLCLWSVVSYVVMLHSSSFQDRISLLSSSDQFVSSLLNSVMFTTSVKFVVVRSVDMLCVTRCCIDTAVSSSGVSCIYIRHLLSHSTYCSFEQ